MATCCPGLNVYAARRSSGTARLSATESSVSCWIALTISGWNSGRATRSVLLEPVEGLGALVAHPQRLAGGRAEPAELPGGRRAALRAPDGEGERHPGRRGR